MNNLVGAIAGNARLDRALTRLRVGQLLENVDVTLLTVLRSSRGVGAHLQAEAVLVGGHEDGAAEQERMLSARRQIGGGRVERAIVLEPAALRGAGPLEVGIALLEPVLDVRAEGLRSLTCAT